MLELFRRRPTGDDQDVCRCPEPLTDDLAGAISSDEDDDDPVCWRCRRPIFPPAPDEGR